VTDYSPAPEVQEIAQKLITTVDEHHMLGVVNIVYVWREKAQKSKGRTTLATARLVTGLNAYLANFAAGETLEALNDSFFVIEVAADTWEQLRPEQRIALVDHELCHCKVAHDENDQLQLGTRGHDVEEFAAIIDRHGLWKPDVAQFASRIAEQLALAVEEAGTFLIGHQDPPSPDSEGGAE
jgi:predicted metallopeptidase